MARRLILLALIAAGVWWYWTRWRPVQNYRALSGHLESAVNQELSTAGVTDKDVLSEVHREHSQWGLSWVESDRQIRVETGRLPALLSRLAAVTQQLGCSVLKQENAESQATLDLGKGPFLMQHLIFVTTPVKAEGWPVPTGPEVAFVIDDVAYDLNAMDHFAALGVPLTFAILPRDKNTKALAEKATQLHFPVILHLPMEPLDLAHNNPGGAGLYLNMTPDQLHQQFEKDVASVPYIQGMNNHMGSAFTENADKMALVMKWVKEKNLFFLDSRTSLHSVVPKVAKQFGVPCLVNETFLDNADDATAIEHQLDIVLKLALKHKRTIAIGHYRRKHLVEALANRIPEFRARGVMLVTLPSLYPRP
jgi:polysaccharide deacetylase 2 family uncharacterized protein YibQ